MEASEGVERRQRFNQFFCLLTEHLKYDEGHWEANIHSTARRWGFNTEEVDGFLASLEKLGLIEITATDTKRMIVRLTYEAIKRADLCVLLDL